MTSTFNIAHVAGDKIKIKKFDAHTRKDILLLLLMDISFLTLPREFIEPFQKDKIDVRFYLARLNSLQYPIRIFEEITGKNDKRWMEFVDRFSHFRREWFNLGENKYGMMMKYGKKAIDISFDMVESFSTYLKDNNIIQQNKKRISLKTRYIDSRYPTIFLDEWDKASAIELMEKIFDSSNILVSILPASLSAQLSVYSRCRGLISDHIRGSLQDHNWELSNTDNANRRIQLLNQHMEFIERNKKRCGWFFDFGYTPRISIFDYYSHEVSRYLNHYKLDKILSQAFSAK
jgi:hypothetical protein